MGSAPDRRLAWVRELNEWRLERQRSFDEEADAVLCARDRYRSASLCHYPPEPAWRLPALVVRSRPTAVLEIVHRRGLPPAVFTKYAVVVLRFPSGSIETLALYALNVAEAGRAVVEPFHLLMPFLDATGGRETPRTGRYVEFENPLAGDRSEAETVVDFNYATNLACAYCDDCRCPLPPSENWVRDAVRAGERLPMLPATA